MNIQEGVGLAHLTWWKIGGPADYFCSPKTVDEVQEALVWADQNQQAVTVLGGGSNVLISDQGVQGLVISTRDLNKIEAKTVRDGRLEIVALAGAKKAELTKIFLQHKLMPALFLCGLPGDLAGGVVMNAGVGEMIAPREFVEIVDWIEVVRPDGIHRYLRENLLWEYRHSSGWQPGVIARVAVSWPDQPQVDLVQRVREATRNRTQRQPLEWPSCGSTFRNPPGEKSGRLIEAVGLKGLQIGGIQVSEKHANFLINRGGALATDAMQMIRHIQKTVKEQKGVDLVPEVQFLGRWP